MASYGAVISGAKAIPGAAPPSAAPQIPGAPWYGGVSPLQQDLNSGGPAGSGWSRGYGSFLPRPADTFTAGAFGPFSPILPVPVDEPDPGFDRAPARREEYRVGWDLPVGQPGAEGIKLADFSTLRTLADLYSVARACIQLRKSEIRGLEWDITPTPDAAKAMRGDKSSARDFGQRRGEALRFFRRPDPDYFSWNTWLDALLEEIFVFDALSLVLRPKWGKGMKKGLLGSDLDSLELISGQTIRPLYDIHGATPRPPAPGYQQYLYGVPRVDLMTMITERDIEQGGLSGAEVTSFRGDQMLYLPMVPRRWTPYGFPPIERALIPVMTGLNKQGYQLDYYREGTVPAVYISPGGVNANYTPNQIRELQDALNAVAGDTAFHHKIIVLPADSSVHPQRPTQLADQLDEIVMNQVCMAFDVQPMELGIMPKVSTTASPGAANQMAKSSGNVHERVATKPLLKFLSDICNRVLHGVCGQEDMQFVFEGLEVDEDEETKTNLLVSQLTHGLRSIDECRDELALQPWGLPETSDPGFLIATGFVPLGQITAGGDVAGGPQPDAAHPAGAQPPAAGTPPQLPPGRPSPRALPPGNTPPGGDSGSRNTSGTGNAGQSPGHEAAEAAVSRTSATSTGTASAGTGKSPHPAALMKLDTRDRVHHARRSRAVAAAQTTVLTGLRSAVDAHVHGTVPHAHAVDQAVSVLNDGYRRVMSAATQDASADFSTDPEFTQLTADGGPDVSGAAAARAESQRGYLSGLLRDALAAFATGTLGNWLTSRLNLYGNTLTGAYNSGYGTAVRAAHPEYEIEWRLGHTEHCKLCLARDGQMYTFDTLPGYPGDGGFGGRGALCEGGPNCGCSLVYYESGRAYATGVNTQRPASIPYYRQQLSDITAARQEALAARDAFVASLPNQLGSDNTSAQLRAASRDDLRRELAQLANQRIRATGGYPGVSVEPEDIPASVIAGLLPQYGPIPPDIPLTSLMDAVDQMFTGKFASLDVTKAAFGAILAAAVLELTDTLRGTAGPREPDTPPGTPTDGGPSGPAVPGGPPRHLVAELEALARHVRKGRDPDTWRRRAITPQDVTAVTEALSGGATTGQAVAKALTRRVLSNGQEVWTDTPQPLPDASGGGGYVLHPHDADGIQHGSDDLTGPARKSADAPGDGGVRAAGLAVHARDTGRVLMLQRALSGDDEHAGQWEFPGGVLEDGESPRNAAYREWMEETGCALPRGTVTGTWTSGPYRGYVLTVEREQDVPVFRDRDTVLNPDDPDGDAVEALAWWDPEQLTDNPAVRDELRASLPELFTALSGEPRADKRAVMSKQQARYRVSTSPHRRCGTCSMYRPDPDDPTSGTCTLVTGLITADAVCDHWDPAR